MILIRPVAWWNNKVPLSAMMLLLLMDGKPLTLDAAAVFLCLIGTVCCVANYGYSLNELFDVEEDHRGGRANAAQDRSVAMMWAIISLSGVCALCLAAAFAGPAGFLLTAVELVLPFAYSVPPFRIKERGWWGVFSDAAAAHLFPAMLALLLVTHRSLVVAPPLLVGTAALWSTATGVRGILSHQLKSDDYDRGAGLLTVAHQLGHVRLKSIVIFAILPVEFMVFSGMLLQFHTTAFLKIVACTFVLYELLKTTFKIFPALVFTKKGENYIPFVDEGFYKVWGPLAVAFDASVYDRRYLMIIPVFLFLFRPRVHQEWEQVRVVARTSAARLRGMIAAP